MRWLPVVLLCGCIAPDLGRGTEPDPVAGGQRHRRDVLLAGRRRAAQQRVRQQPHRPRFAIGTDGNVEAEPKLVGNGDYHLQPASPAKDTGCHGASAREADGTLPDIGAYGGPLAAWTQL